MTSDRAFYQQLKHKLEKESVVLATIVKIAGSAPREVGAKMAVCQDKSIIGTIGGGAGEGKAIQQAMTVLETGNKQLVDIDLTGAPGRDIQGVCGGRVQVWLERWKGWEATAVVEQILDRLAAGKTAKLITPLIEEGQPYLIEQDNFGDADSLPYRHFSEKRVHNSQPPTAYTATSDCFIEIIQPLPLLFIVGGGHVAVALARVARLAGFQIAVTDDRPEFLTSQRFPNALLFPGHITEALDLVSSFSQIYIALVTRGYQQDLIALQSILEHSLVYKYIGAIGSQKRIGMICQALQHKEISIERLKQFYAPIGLDIGALTPEEIAVSICAELIKVCRGGTGLSLSEMRRTNH